MQYDYLIVGAGLFGCVFAHELTKIGKKCLVIDRRKHIGGNTYCQQKDDINVHFYGPHIFHTNDKAIWDYVNSFVEFNHYIHSPIAHYKGKIYNLPFNMNTFYQLWGSASPQEVAQIIQTQIKESGITKPSNLEEQAISLVGKDIYEILIKGYTEKQWGKKASELPAFIIKRLPVRFTFDNNYFNDKYQGIPIGGYNKLTEGLLQGIEVRLETDYFENRSFWERQSRRIVYTGKIDQFYGYCFGELEYRSLQFEHQHLEIPNFQGNTQVNYTDSEVPFTRIVEHKHFEFGAQPTTIITREYPKQWRKGDEPYYPINDEANNQKFKKYEALAENESNVIFGGRLAEYRYYDMHQIIASALVKARKEIAACSLS